MSMKFTLQHKDPASKARAGELATDHGVIRTPIFMPVGTAATVKGIFHRDVRDEARAQIILANTYHLYMRPGMDDHRKGGGRTPFLDLGRADAHRQRRLPGLLARRLAASSRRRDAISDRTSTVRKHLFTPESVDGHRAHRSAPTS